jgi:hypothetical protein
MAHAIRLREPWVVTCLAAERLEFRRRFQCPPALRAADRVWLTITGLPPATQVTVNGRSIDQADDVALGMRHDIRALVQPRNEIVITLSLDNATTVTIDETADRLRREVLAAGLVRLEIE